MEDKLESVAEDDKNWKDLLKEFWEAFFPLVEIAEKEAFVPKITTDKDCPECGHKLQKIWAKKKYFYGCSNYPTCSFTIPLEALEFNKDEYDPNFDWDQKCPKCANEMKLRFGKFGPFLGCTNYPECRGIVNIPKKGELPLEEMPTCPALGCDGKLTPRRSRFGKIFYSCSNYPDCDVISNDLDHIGEKYENHPKTPYVPKKKGKKETASSKTTSSKKASKKSAKKPAKKTSSRKQPEYSLSPELAKIVGSDSLSRPEVVKEVWKYIKEHNCQDSKNKRLIVPDALLVKVFGSKEPIDMMKLSGILNSHIKKP
jgi:DNA topoisomerase-1